MAAKDYVTERLNQGKIRTSKSPYGAPLLFVKRKDKLRGVIDYRAQNSITKRNNTPLPRTDEMIARLGKAKIFSKLDLKSGFHQIRVKNEDIGKTAFGTKYGHYEFSVMPMGLRDAPATFQTLMNLIFSDIIADFVVIFLDDLLVYNDSYEDHLNHMQIVLLRLMKNELYVGKSKCEIITPRTEFLGLPLGVDCISVGEDRKKIVRKWPRPQNLTKLRGFIGFLQYFRRFIQRFSQIPALLTNLT